MNSNRYEIGVGATPELSLRVSIATLVRVLFKNPSDGEMMLALERRATLHETENGHGITIKSQPFGGAIRILDLNAVRDLIGDFRFDSERSRTEQDFRIFIQPSAWSVLREFCLQHLNRDNDSILETDPARELVEEFADTLKINLQSKQYICKPISTLVENEAAPTENIHARGIPTVRIYRIFEVCITDSSLAHAMLKNNENFSEQDLYKLALDDFQKSGKGRANAILILPLKPITDYYASISPNERNVNILFEKHQLDETVSAILEGITAPKYQRL